MPHHDRLSHLIYYSLEYDSKRPCPYLVRLPGGGTDMIDGLPYKPVVETRDRLFFGKTFEEVVDHVLGIHIYTTPKITTPHSHFIPDDY